MCEQLISLKAKITKKNEFLSQIKRNFVKKQDFVITHLFQVSAAILFAYLMGAPGTGYIVVSGTPFLAYIDTANVFLCSSCFLSCILYQGKLNTVNVKDSLGALQFLRHEANTYLSHYCQWISFTLWMGKAHSS